jgi:hypothetical protein
MRSTVHEFIAAHEHNIRRYRWMLTTPMTELEQQYVQRRISEECSAIVRMGGCVDPEIALARTSFTAKVPEPA